jgi:hypothetical protein
VIAPTTIAPLGWHGVPASAASARHQLARGLPKGVARLVTRAHPQATAAVNGAQHLSSDAFVLRSAGAAHQVIASYRRAHHASHLALGADGVISRQKQGRTTRYAVAWRRGARVGLVQLQVPTRMPDGRALAIAMAKLQDQAFRIPTPSTGYGKIAAQIHPDGTVSAATALQAFALSYGGLPGVKVPPGTGSVPDADGVEATSWVFQHMSQYPQRTQNAIAAKLGVTPTGNTASARVAADDFTPNADLTAIANAWAHTYPGKMSTGALKYTISAGTSTVFDGTHSVADALPVDAGGHYNVDGPTCRIRFQTSKDTPAAAQYISKTLAHEVFHCFQFMIAGAHWRDLPAWTLEGTAEWAALTVTQPGWDTAFPDASSGWMRVYMSNPQTPLFTRTYDAAGFWGHVQDTYGDLFTRVKSALVANGSDAIFAAVGGNDANFLNSWASSMVDRPGGTAAWHLTSPITAPDGKGVAHDNITFSAGSPITLINAAAFTTKHFIVQPSAAGPLVHIKLSGHPRASLKHDYTVELKDGWFCMAGDQAACQCPSGQHGEVPAGFHTDGAMELEVTGDPGTGSSGSVEYASLNKFCKAVYNVPSPGAGARGH